MGSETGLRDINKEIVTKMVPVRAVDLSIGPFCTEFWRERFRDSDFFESATADRPSRSRQSGLPQPIGRSPPPADGADWKFQPIGRLEPADRSRLTVE